MASKEEEPHQTWVLRVSIHCEGCKKKVKKILQKVSGVFAVEIDSKQNKVTVTGNVDADTLIRRLAKSGKQAEMWPEKKPANPNPNLSPSSNPKPSPSSNPKGKNKEKEQEATGGKEQPAAEKVAIKDKTPADTSSEKPSKPAEKEKKPAETAAEPAEIEASKSSTKEEDTKPDKKPETAQADTSSESDPKPAEEPETSSKAGKSGKKKGKKQAESSSAAAPAASEVHVRNLPPQQQLPHQVPVYQHPVYAVSYNMAHPAATSHSYYAAMPPAPQSYTHSSHPSGGYSQQPPQEYYPSANYGSNYYSSSENRYGSMESSASPVHSSQRGQNYYDSYYSAPHSSNYYASESYSGSMDPRASPAHPSQTGLDMFSDENANACKIM